MTQSKLLSQSIQWLETNEQLAECCRAWNACKLISVDTEFMRSRTYYPVAGLFQVNDGKANYLIDPTTISDWSPLCELFENPDIIKVLHSCSEDLEVFHRVLGCLPVNLLDTQVAAAMLGYGFSIGFANLCSAILEIDLPKAETRSNWLQRPLSESQIHYAALDVEYLTVISVKLIRELQQAGRLGWVREECEKLKDNFAAVQNPNLSWTRGKGAWKLSPRGLYFFQKLSLWRELKAQTRDVPRNRVLKDHAMMAMAQDLPGDVTDLKGIDGISERMLQSDGAEFIQLADEAAAVPDAELPASLPRPLPSSTKDQARKLRDVVQLKADELNLSAELLMRKKDYEELLRSGLDGGEYALSENIQGWRKELLHDLLLNAVNADSVRN